MKRTRPKRPMTPDDYETFYRLVHAQAHGKCWGCEIDPGARWKCGARSAGRRA